MFPCNITWISQLKRKIFSGKIVGHVQSINKDNKHFKTNQGYKQKYKIILIKITTMVFKSSRMKSVGHAPRLEVIREK